MMRGLGGRMAQGLCGAAMAAPTCPARPRWTGGQGKGRITPASHCGRCQARTTHAPAGSQNPQREATSLGACITRRRLTITVGFVAATGTQLSSAIPAHRSAGSTSTGLSGCTMSPLTCAVCKLRKGTGFQAALHHAEQAHIGFHLRHEQPLSERKHAHADLCIARRVCLLSDERSHSFLR